MPVAIEAERSQQADNEMASDNGEGGADVISVASSASDHIDNTANADLTPGEQPIIGGVQGPRGEVIVGGRIVVFTDGACRNNQHKALRRAGVGGFWAHDHPLNFGECLLDGEQTNNRAELFALIKVLRVDSRPLEVRSDSKYVIDGVLKHRFRWKRSGWRGKRKDIANADLWRELDELLD